MRLRRGISSSCDDGVKGEFDEGGMRERYGNSLIEKSSKKLERL
jgi:hypothetical protein